MQKAKSVFCCSGGKDSAFALYRALTGNQFDVTVLLSTMNSQFRRLSMHGVREDLIDRQAASIGIPLEKVWVSQGSNEEYENQMATKLIELKDLVITHVLFGDIFLEDLRAYREKNLARIGLKAGFPIWKMDTRELIRSFLEKGFETKICCVNKNWLGEEWLGRKIDNEFMANLPAAVDPCGENGEFHSFCYKGPIFNSEISFAMGETQHKTFEDPVSGNEVGFCYLDLIGI